MELTEEDPRRRGIFRSAEEMHAEAEAAVLRAGGVEFDASGYGGRVSETASKYAAIVASAPPRNLSVCTQPLPRRSERAVLEKKLASSRPLAEGVRGREAGGSCSPVLGEGWGRPAAKPCGRAFFDNANRR